MSTLWGSFEIRNSRLIKKMMGQLANKSFDADPADFNQWADMFEQLPMHFLRFFGSTSVRGCGTAGDEILSMGPFNARRGRAGTAGCRWTTCWTPWSTPTTCTTSGTLSWTTCSS